MDLKEKKCLITGASSGLGFAVSKQFCKLGAHVILLCRNKEKGLDALKEIKKEAPNASAELMICDLSSIKSVKEFLQKFKSKYTELHLLFNNASVMKKRYTKTEDGFETMFQTNYIAPFILTTSLVDLLKNASSARVINIGVPPDKLRLDFDDLQSSKNYKTLNSFFKTKLCVLFFSLELERRLNGTHIKVVNTDPGPGPFKSNLIRESPVIGFLKNLISKSVDQVAKNIVYLSFSNEVELKSDNIFSGIKKRPLTEYWRDESIRKRLWSITESLTQ